MLRILPAVLDVQKYLLLTEKKHVMHVEYPIKIAKQNHESKKDKEKSDDYIYIKDLAEIIVENITKFKENTQPNNNSNTFKFFYLINIMEFQDDSKVIADNIAEIISEADEYNWM
jgi:hypothetical protein